MAIRISTFMIIGCFVWAFRWNLDRGPSGKLSLLVQTPLIGPVRVLPFSVYESRGWGVLQGFGIGNFH